MQITGVILAAGTSSRMDSSNKLLLPYKNHTVIEEVLSQLSDSKVDDIIVVTGFEHARIEELLAGSLTDKVGLVHNGDYLLGRAESIKCAIRKVMDTADAALFMVADKPGVSHTLIDRAIDRFRKDRPAVLYVQTPAGRGHPIIFSKTLFDELLLLEGDRVGNDLIGRYKNDTIRLNDETVQIDIDTEEDYRILLKNRTGKQ